ncbi:MAG: translation initiation factor IF-2 N-terminal domain-containing protein, partial [Kiloniellales bacterium]
MESTDKGLRKPLKLSQPGKLELKKTVQTGQVKQSFSHGRSKTVTVEVKRKRTFAPNAGGRMAEVVEKPAITLKPLAEEARERPAETHAEIFSKPKRTLTEEERAARFRALEDAQRAAEQAAKQAEADQASDALRIARESAERAEAEEKQRLDDARSNRRAEEESRRRADEEAKSRAEDAAQRASEAERRRREAEAAAATPAAAADSARDRSRGKGPGAKVPARGGRTANRRRGGKLTISEALDEEGGERRRSVAAFRRRQERERQRARQAAGGPVQKFVREVVVPETITVGELANRMAERGGEVMKALMKMGVMATINQAIDQDTAELLVDGFG